MSDGQIVELGSICEFKYGKSLPSARRRPGDVPVYGSNGIVGCHDQPLTSGPTVIVGRKGSFGEIHFSDRSCWPIDTTYFVDRTCTDVDLKWLAYLLPRLGLKHLNRAAAVPGLNRDDAYRRRLRLPPMDEQRRIASILDKADQLQAKRREAIGLARSLTQSVYQAMLPTEAPRIPLSEALSSASIFTDGDWVESKDQDPNGEVRLTQLADIGDGHWLDKSARFLTKAKAAELRCTYLQPGDVLIARMPDPLGRACIFPGDEMSCVTVVDVCIVRPDLARHTPEWLMACINSDEVRRQIDRLATGTTRSRVSRGNLHRVLVPDVSVLLQQSFSEAMRGLEDTMAKMGEASSTASRLHASLAYRAFQMAPTGGVV